MLQIHLLCIGKLKERFYTDASKEYEKRLSSHCKLTISELPEERLPDKPSATEIDIALHKEAEKIRANIPKGANLIALCIEGKLSSSEDLAKQMHNWMLTGSSTLVFVIGGSHGLHKSIKDAANLRLSMSKMTFPHHLARIMILEQIYRSFQIIAGTKYHK